VAEVEGHKWLVQETERIRVTRLRLGAEVELTSKRETCTMEELDAAMAMAVEVSGSINVCSMFARSSLNVQSMYNQCSINVCLMFQQE
jgi:hypothetical protein